MTEVPFSRESLDLFATLLAQVQLSPTSDDFEAQAVIVGRARRELLSVLRKEDEDAAA